MCVRLLRERLMCDCVCVMFMIVISLLRNRHSEAERGQRERESAHVCVCLCVKGGGGYMCTLGYVCFIKLSGSGFLFTCVSMCTDVHLPVVPGVSYFQTLYHFSTASPSKTDTTPSSSLRRSSILSTTPAATTTSNNRGGSAKFIMPPAPPPPDQWVPDSRAPLCMVCKLERFSMVSGGNIGRG